MRATLRKAGRATVHLLVAAAMAFGMYLFITVLLITAIGALAFVGCWLLPETVILVRRIAGAKRSLTTAWTGREIPEAYRTIEGPLAERLRTAVRDPGTLLDLRWMAAYYVYGALVFLALPLWPIGLIVDGVSRGLLRRRAVVLPWIVRLADLEAAWSTALLRPSPKALLAARVEQLTATRADAIAAHGAELRRIERDLHDGAQAGWWRCPCGSGWPSVPTTVIRTPLASCWTTPRRRPRRRSPSCATSYAASIRRS